MNFQTYKIIDTVNGYFFYDVSSIHDEDFMLKVAESYAAEFPDEAINQYFNNCVGWDDVDIEKSDLDPIDVIQNKFPSTDPLNMNVSDAYKKLTEEALAKLSAKKSRVKKVKDSNTNTENGHSPFTILADAKTESTEKQKKVSKPKAKNTNTPVSIEVPTEPIILN